MCLYFCIRLRPLFPEGVSYDIGLLFVLRLTGLCPQGSSSTAGGVAGAWVVWVSYHQPAVEWTLSVAVT